MLKPYFETELGKLYCGDCLEIMPELEPVDLVLKNSLTNNTKSEIIRHEEKQERSIQDGGGKGVVGAKKSGNQMALPRTAMVNGTDSGLFRSFSSRNKQDNPSFENQIKGQGQEGKRKRQIQGREIKHSLPPTDRKRQMLKLPNNERLGCSPQKRESLRQPAGESSNPLRELPWQLSQKAMVGKTEILCLTDPPYNIFAGRGGGCFGNRKHLVDTGGFTDGGCDYSFLKNFKNWFCFCSLKQLDELLKIASMRERRNLITWCKPNPVPTCNNKYLPDVEYVVHGFSKGRLFGSYKDKSSFSVINCGNKKTKHPNEKPLALILKLITCGSEKGDLILDPFLGSGTTAIACERLNRRWIGIEISKEYCEIAKKRISKETRQLRFKGF